MVKHYPDGQNSCYDGLDSHMESHNCHHNGQDSHQDSQDSHLIGQDSQQEGQDQSPENTQFFLQTRSRNSKSPYSK